MILVSEYELLERLEKYFDDYQKTRNHEYIIKDHNKTTCISCNGILSEY